jgi:hypothetical protein
MALDGQIAFGLREEWIAFQSRNKEFFARLPNLQAALDGAFLRTIYTSELLDQVMFLMGRLCVEDFFEILLLAANGYGFGAFKILRGLYERAVTLAYLNEHPEEIDAFTNFYWISQHKVVAALTSCYGDDVLPTQVIEETEGNYRAFKERYLVADCKTCGTKRLNHTWSRLDFVSMAKQSGSLGKLIVEAYYLPLSHAHSTMTSFLSRLEERPEEGFGFNPEAQPAEADMALRVAHLVILGVLEVQVNHFNPEGLEGKFQTALQDFNCIWPGKRPAETP